MSEREDNLPDKCCSRCRYYIPKVCEPDRTQGNCNGYSEERYTRWVRDDYVCERFVTDDDTGDAISKDYS